MTTQKRVGDVSHLLRMVGQLFAVRLGPLILVMLVGAAPIIGIFGAAYAYEATALPRYFALSLVPFTIVTLALARRAGEGALHRRAGNHTPLRAMAAVGLDMILIRVTESLARWRMALGGVAGSARRDPDVVQGACPDPVSAPRRGTRDPQLAGSHVRMSR